MQMVAVAVCLALITAFGELVLFAILKFALDREMHLGPSVVWITPVARLVVFSAPALLLILLSRVWPRVAQADVYVATLVFLMTINLILVSGDERFLSAAHIRVIAEIAVGGNTVRSFTSVDPGGSALRHRSSSVHRGSRESDFRTVSHLEPWRVPPGELVTRFVTGACYQRGFRLPEHKTGHSAR